MAHALFSDYARAFPGFTTSQWKEFLITIFPAFLAEAEGRPIPPPIPRESTLTMSAETMSNLIEMCLWLGAELGIYNE